MQPLSVNGLRVELLSDTPDSRSTTVNISGEIDVSNAGALRDALEIACEPGRRLFLEMANVTFIDSSAVRVLLAVGRLAGEAHGGLIIKSPGPNVRKVLDILGLTHHFGLE